MMKLLVFGENAHRKRHRLHILPQLTCLPRMQISEAVVQEYGYLINLTLAAVDSCNVENVLCNSNRFRIEEQLDRICFVMFLGARTCCRLSHGTPPKLRRAYPRVSDAMNLSGYHSFARKIAVAVVELM